MPMSVVGRLVAAGGTALAVSFLVVPHADARGWGFGGRGGFSGSVTRYNYGGGNFGRTVTATRPDGQTASRTFNRSVNNGVVTDSRSVTGFNGATATGTLTRTPGQGWSANYTGRGGQSWSASRSPYNDGNGNFGRTTTTTGPAGTTTRQLNQTNNGNGTFTDSRTVTAPNGQTYSNSYTRY